MTRSIVPTLLVPLSLVLVGGAAASDFPPFRCGLLDADGVRVGPPVLVERRVPPTPLGHRSGPPLSSSDIFPFEDTGGVLLTNFTVDEFKEILVAAANALVASHGDFYDFVGVWTNFDPHHTIGLAVYFSLMNDVSGIGPWDPGGPEIYDNRPGLGLGSAAIEGMVIMYNVNSPWWEPGVAPGADFTRLALAQEYEHRYACFLLDLLDGRVLQGDDASCGRSGHWSWKTDGQGSAMELSEWTGVSPALLQSSGPGFNSEIPPGLFGWPDLYLMGYVTPAEMDAGISQFRYMNNSSSCSPFYGGVVSSIQSADIIASNGPRVPDAASETQDYRTGWVMIHRSGDPPSGAELTKAVQILEQQAVDWNLSTLGRGTMNHTLEDPTPAPVPVVAGAGVRLDVPIPNPLSDEGAISFALDRGRDVVITLHDVHGRTVRTLARGHWSGGRHSIVWNAGRDGVAAGVYFVRLETESVSRTTKVVVRE